MNNGMWIIRTFLLALFLALVGMLIYAYGAGTVLAWAIGILVVIVGLPVLFRGGTSEQGTVKTQAQNKAEAAARTSEKQYRQQQREQRLKEKQDDTIVWNHSNRMIVQAVNEYHKKYGRAMSDYEFQLVKEAAKWTAEKELRKQAK